MQSSSQIVTTYKPTPSYLQAGCPSCHPTNSVIALKGNVVKLNCTSNNSKPVRRPEALNTQTCNLISEMCLPATHGSLHYKAIICFLLVLTVHFTYRLKQKQLYGDL